MFKPSHIVETIQPGLFTDMNAYWAMQYCAILETLYEQKTLQHGFQRRYTPSPCHSLAGLVTVAGPTFFSKISASMKNFGLQILLCHYLRTSEGAPVFFNIIDALSSMYNVDLKNHTFEYGVFVSCKDFASGARFMQQYNPLLMGHHSALTLQEAASSVSYADLCILIKTNQVQYGILGEVEGNRGRNLLLKSFWEKKQGTYYSFGIGVQHRNKPKPSIIEPPVVTAQYIPTGCGYKYVVIFDNDFALIDDFHSALDTLNIFCTMGSNQRGNFDKTLQPILNIIKDYWAKDILELIYLLRTFLSAGKAATLGTNSLPELVVPKIIV